MPNPDFVILYVSDVAGSVNFYRQILQRAPLEASPSFAMFEVSKDLKLGLWRRADAAGERNRTGEFAFVVPDKDSVERQHEAWRNAGLEIVQTPRPLDFGYTCLAIDPDGFGLRVFAPGAA